MVSPGDHLKPDIHSRASHRRQKLAFLSPVPGGLPPGSASLPARLSICHKLTELDGHIASTSSHQPAGKVCPAFSDTQLVHFGDRESMQTHPLCAFHSSGRTHGGASGTSACSRAAVPPGSMREGKGRAFSAARNLEI